MNLETQRARLAAILAPRQQTFDFARSKLWQQLPHTDQEACRQAITNLLHQVVAQPEQENKEDER